MWGQNSGEWFPRANRTSLETPKDEQGRTRHTEPPRSSEEEAIEQFVLLRLFLQASLLMPMIWPVNPA